MFKAIVANANKIASYFGETLNKVGVGMNDAPLDTLVNDGVLPNIHSDDLSLDIDIKVPEYSIDQQGPAQLSDTVTDQVTDEVTDQVINPITGLTTTNVISNIDTTNGDSGADIKIDTVITQSIAPEPQTSITVDGAVYQIVMDLKPILAPIIGWIEWFNLTYVPLILMILLRSYCLVESLTHWIMGYVGILIAICFFKVYVNKNNTKALKEASNLFFNFVIVMLIEMVMKYSLATDPSVFVPTDMMPGLLSNILSGYGSNLLNDPMSLILVGSIMYSIYLVRRMIVGEPKNNLDQDVEDTRRGSYINIWHMILYYVSFMFNVRHITFIVIRLLPMLVERIAYSKYINAYMIIYGLSFVVVRNIIKYLFRVDIKVDSVLLAMVCMYLHSQGFQSDRFFVC